MIGQKTKMGGSKPARKAGAFELLDGVHTGKCNPDHRPSDLLEDIEPMPGKLILLRPRDPERDGDDQSKTIVVPETAKDSLRREYPPNCALVVAAGPGTTTPVGWYVFFAQKVENDKVWLHKPQPLSFAPSDTMPALWIIDEANILARCPPRPMPAVD